MSTVKENLVAYLATRKGGDEGSASSIVFASAYYGEDDELRPSHVRTGDITPKIAITSYGGFIAKHYEVPAENIVKNWSGTIGSSYALLDNVWETLDAEEFALYMDDLTLELTKRATAKTATEALIGKPAEKLASQMLKATQGLANVALSKGHFSMLSRVTMVDARNALTAQINALESVKE